MNARQHDDTIPATITRWRDAGKVFRLALCVLALVGPGCAGGSSSSSSGCKLGRSGASSPATSPPSIVGRATGTWQGPWQERLTSPTPTPHESMTMTVSADGTFTAAMRDATTGEESTLTGKMENYADGQGSGITNPAGYFINGLWAFPSRGFRVSGDFMLTSNARLFGTFQVYTNADGSPTQENRQVSFDLARR